MATPRQETFAILDRHRSNPASIRKSSHLS
jgi:hypothetical protein